MADTKETNKRRLEGVITSDKMDKTVVVIVTRSKKHPKYLKYRDVSQKFKAHDEINEYKEGDKVIIEESRPYSKDKKWRVIRKQEDRMTGEQNQKNENEE